MAEDLQRKRLRDRLRKLRRLYGITEEQFEVSLRVIAVLSVDDTKTQIDIKFYS